VEVIDHGGKRLEFCCPACARIWMRRQPEPPRSVTVTDEASGELIDAAAACYVRSAVVTTPGTGNRVHVFRNRADAAKHAERFGGHVLSDSENPLRP
jgi:nitrous oxide reductase accessory protein NosL